LKRPYYIEGDERKTTLQERVEQFALAVALDIEIEAKDELIQKELKILNSLTNALIAIKS
jgi:hypothetical protein